MIHRAPSLWGACALLLWSSACEVDEPSSVALEDVEAALSAELCDRMFSCRCNQGRTYESLARCEQEAAQLARELEAVPMEQPGIELVYDPACMGAVIDRFADAGCSSVVPAPEGDGACTGRCVPPGAACVPSCAPTAARPKARWPRA